MIEVNNVLTGGVDFDEARINKNQLTEVIETWRRNRLTEAFKVEGGVITPRTPEKATSGKIWPDPLAKFVALVKGSEEERNKQIRRITQAVTNIDQVKLVEIYVLEDDDEECLSATVESIASGIADRSYDILVVTAESVLSASPEKRTATVETILSQHVPSAVYFLEEEYGIVNCMVDREFVKDLAAHESETKSRGGVYRILVEE